jgi:hypothetical protein
MTAKTVLRETPLFASPAPRFLAGIGHSVDGMAQSSLSDVETLLRTHNLLSPVPLNPEAVQKDHLPGARPRPDLQRPTNVRDPGTH